MTLLRNVLAIVAGLVIGMAINMAIVVFGPSIIPPPAGVDVNDVESIRASLHLYEAKHFISPFLAHALGTLVGAIAAYLIAASHQSIIALVVGVFFLAGGIAASMMIPAPVWFIVLDLVVAYIPMAWIGLQIGRRFSGGRASHST